MVSYLPTTIVPVSDVAYIFAMCIDPPAHHTIGILILMKDLRMKTCCYIIYPITRV